jgi:hypothetical protein
MCRILDKYTGPVDTNQALYSEYSPKSSTFGHFYAIMNLFTVLEMIRHGGFFARYLPGHLV